MSALRRSIHSWRKGDFLTHEDLTLLPLGTILFDDENDAWCKVHPERWICPWSESSMRMDAEGCFETVFSHKADAGVTVGAGMTVDRPAGIHSYFPVRYTGLVHPNVEEAFPHG